MNGYSAGLEPADRCRAINDHLRDARDALRVVNATAKTACDLGEHKLQREAEDCAARLVAVIEQLQEESAACERQRSG